MVKRAFPFVLLAVAMAIATVPAGAKDLSAYKTGDVADEDIVASVPLDVIDPVATAARRQSEAQKTPTIFLSLPDTTITNAIVQQFTAAFATMRSNFMAGLAQKFPVGGQVNPEDFANFLSDFNEGNKSFPVSSDLAHKWASGDAAADIQSLYLGYILRMMHRPVRADELPAGFALGDTFRLVAVKNASDKPTLAEADRGKTVPEMTALSRLQMLLRRQFPTTDTENQALARALGTFLKPNCVLDAPLTQQMRDRDTSQLVAVAHYDAGQVIVHKGEAVDAKAKAAIAMLDEKLAPVRLAQQMAEQAKAQQEQLKQQQLAAQHEREQALAQAQAAQAQADKAKRDAAIAMQREAQAAKVKMYWLAGIAGGVVLVIIASVLIVMRRKPKVQAAPVKAELMKAPEPEPMHLRLQQQPHMIHSELAPQVARVVKEAVVQELAAQRSELMRVQQSAAAELTELVHRLDNLQTPLTERLKAYETRIDELERQLSSRTEENRELLKAKIDLTRQQLETERAGMGSDWSSAIN